MQVHFDSSHGRDRKDFASYNALTNRLMYPAVRSSDRVPVDGRLLLASTEIAGLLLLQLARPPGASARSLRHDRVDAMFVSVLDAGQASLETDGQRIVQNIGDVVVWNAGQPHEWSYAQGLSSICLRLPSAWLRRAAPQARIANRLLPGSSPMGALVASTVRQIATLPTSDGPQVAPHLRAVLLHVLCASLDEATPANGNRLADAKRYMLERLDDSELTPQQVAQALGLSLRSLARLFAAEGSAPCRWLWDERLAQARRLLELGETRRVTDVALACGFTSFSHFSRAFRQTHGVPPSALLNRA